MLLLIIELERFCFASENTKSGTDLATVNYDVDFALSL